MHIKWPSISSFHNVRKAINNYTPLVNGNYTVTYRGKIKLHGTNACVQIQALDQGATPEMNVVAQSRTSIITIKNDNAGFARWVSDAEDDWRTVDWYKLRQLVAGKRLNSVCYFGEWCGPGIQKGTAINNIDKKIFAIFGVMLVVEGEELPRFICAPAKIKEYTPAVDNTFILPWQTEKVDIDYARSADQLTKDIEEINDFILRVEASDPWVKETFDVDGIGEGIVYYPVSNEHQGRKNFSNLCFKAKGEKHKVIKQKQPVQVNPEVVNSIAKFTDLVVTDARLEQGASEVGNQFTSKNIGPFIGWVTKDVNKECQDELEASGLNWKQVSKEVSNRARTWFLHKIQST